MKPGISRGKFARCASHWNWLGLLTIGAAILLSRAAPATASLGSNGDISNDGVINFTDFQFMSASYGFPVSSPNYSGGDLNGDGVVNELDLVKLYNNLGDTTASPNPPTPPTQAVTLSLVASGGNWSAYEQNNTASLTQGLVGIDFDVLTSGSTTIDTSKFTSYLSTNVDNPSYPNAKVFSFGQKTVTAAGVEFSEAQSVYPGTLTFDDNPAGGLGNGSPVLLATGTYTGSASDLSIFSGPNRIALIGPGSGNGSPTYSPLEVDGTTPVVSLTNFQGGNFSNPIALPSGKKVSSITGSVGGTATQEFYQFLWTGGTFNADSTIDGATSACVYEFELYLDGSGTPMDDTTLNNSNGFFGAINEPTLAAGTYDIGYFCTGPDPSFTMDFGMPVTGLPEPSSISMFAIVLVALALRPRQVKRGWKLLT